LQNKAFRAQTPEAILLHVKRQGPRMSAGGDNHTRKRKMHENDDNTTAPTDDAAASDTNVPAPWQKGGPSPNPKGRPKQPRSVKEVRELARQHTVQMVEVLARVANNPKSPPAARQAAASSLLDRAWGKPSGDFEGAEQLVIKILKLNEAADEDMKVIEGKVEE
jgi:hypothetical protein